MAGSGIERTAAMCRNRWLRMERGVHITEQGLSAYRCSVCGQIKRGHKCPGPSGAEEGAAAPLQALADASMPATQREVTAYVANLIRVADLTTVTLKTIRARLKADRNLEDGRHYDKKWLQVRLALPPSSGPVPLALTSYWVAAVSLTIAPFSMPSRRNSRAKSSGCSLWLQSLLLNLVLRAARPRL